MLIVSPDSTCDVCMESYMDGAGMPHAITCGHIFCRACLDGMQPQCPFCRDDFLPRDIRKLRVDNDPGSTTVVPPKVDRRVQCLLDEIAKTADGGATVEEMQRVIDQCNVYHNAQPDSPHTPLGVSYLLLSTLLEAQRKFLLQADQLSELAAAKDEIRDRLTLELEAVQLKYQNLKQAQRNEKETALKNEEAFRVHYDKMNALWRCKVESTKQKYQSLREELDRLRQKTEKETQDKASSVVDHSDTAIPQHTVAAGSSSDVAAKLDKVEPPAFRLEPYLILVFKVIVASIGCVLFLHASAVVLQLCAK